MLLWFVGTVVFSVHYVFNDPRFDYRLLLVGALLPDLLDLPLGRAAWAHSVTVSVVVLAAVMLATAGRKPVRRLLLGLPIGMLLHLVWDGAFTATRVFWWPMSGGWGDHDVPSIGRGLWNLPLEVAGLLMVRAAWRRFGLSDPVRRRAVAHHGTLTLVTGVTPADEPRPADG
ncbi:MAG: hypothetical protein ACO3C1_11935 [Ilumatobacteraceae bacterium]